jgi:hypothetical protein
MLYSFPENNQFKFHLSSPSKAETQDQIEFRTYIGKYLASLYKTIFPRLTVNSPWWLKSNFQSSPVNLNQTSKAKLTGNNFWIQ